MRYLYFVDGKRRSLTRRVINGAMLKAREPGFDWHYQVFLEREEEPDLLLTDSMNLTMRKRQPLRFYTVPPCGGG